MYHGNKILNSVVKMKMLNKILVMGITILFIGVGIYPAFAVDNKTSVVNQQNEENCGCEVVSKSDLIKVKRLLNRLEVYSKLLLVLSKNHPELVETSEELTNKITILNGMYKGLKANPLLPDNLAICIYLFIIYKFSSPIKKIFQDIYENIQKYPYLYYYLFDIVLNLYSIFYFIVDEAIFWGDYYKCWWINS